MHSLDFKFVIVLHKDHVPFQNNPCTIASDNTMTGTCVTAAECSMQNGIADGNCAAGKLITCGKCNSKTKICV